MPGIIRRWFRRDGEIARAGSKWMCAIFVLAVGLSGCGGGAGGDVLSIVIEKPIQSLDPRVSADSAAERVRQLVFNSLTRKDEKFEAVPDLALSFIPSPDARTYSFTLRPGVRFHDNRTLTSADVKYTFESMLAPDFRSQKKSELAAFIERIETPSETEVVFHCSRPCPNLPNAIVPIGIIPSGSTSPRPPGTGPFAYESYTEDVELLLRSNPDYFAGAPSISRLRIVISPDSSTRESQLRKGEVDLAINADLDPISIESLGSDPGLKVEIKDGTNITHLGVNLTDPLLKDRRVRQAIAYAIDRETIIRDLLRSQARPASSILPLAQWAYEPEVNRYDYDPARAESLLDEAGHKRKQNGERIRLTLKTSGLSISRKTGEAMQEQLRRVGINLELEPLERQKLTQDMNDGNFQLYLNTLVGGNQSTDIMRYVYASSSIPPDGQNRSRYRNPEFDRLLDEAVLASRERQREIFSRAQKMLAEDLPQIYLWYPSTVVIRRLRVSTLDLDPSGDWRSLSTVRLMQQ